MNCLHVDVYKGSISNVTWKLHDLTMIIQGNVDIHVDIQPNWAVNRLRPTDVKSIKWAMLPYFVTNGLAH